MNANGIEATPDGAQLIVVQFNTGLLFSVDPNSSGNDCGVRRIHHHPGPNTSYQIIRLPAT